MVFQFAFNLISYNFGIFQQTIFILNFANLFI